MGWLVPENGLFGMLQIWGSFIFMAFLSVLLIVFLTRSLRRSGETLKGPGIRNVIECDTSREPPRH